MNAVLLALVSGLIGSVATIGVQVWLARIQQKSEAGLLVTVWMDALVNGLSRLHVILEAISEKATDIGTYDEADELSLQVTGLVLSSVERLRVGLVWGDRSTEYQLVESFHQTCRRALHGLNKFHPDLSAAAKEIDRSEDLRAEVQVLMRRAALPSVVRREVYGFED